MEALETRRLLAVTIWAEGETGEETMELQVDGQTVQSWTNVGVGLSSYTYQVNGIAADRILVAFTNDGNTTGGQDKNLRVDRLELDGVVYQTEAPSVFSTGSWSDGNGCDPGFKASEMLHCNGYFQFADPGGTSSTITIRAAGEVGDESMALKIAGVTVAQWNNVGGDLVGAQFNTFSYQHTNPVSIDEVAIAFTNDAIVPGGDRNLRVDNVTLDGFLFETEHPSVRSTGTWSDGVGCAPGNKQDEVLHCGGEFQFAGTSIAVFAAGETGEENMELQIDGSTVAGWNNVAGDPDSGAFERFDYHTTDVVSEDQIRVAFVNDASAPVDRNLHIDRIEINQVVFQSESPATYSTGTWSSGDGCLPGYKSSEVLHCGGYLQFGAGEQPNPGVIALSTNSIEVSEAGSNATVTVTRTGGANGLVTVDYRTVADTALAGQDYTSVSGRLEFLDGETSKLISIPILQDALVEGDESFSVTIDNANGGATLLAPRTAIVTIQDDESPTGLGGFSLDYADFGSVVNLTQNGAATVTGNALRLTPASTNQAGSAFHSSAIEFDSSTSFRTDFSFQLTGGQGTGGADGFTFALHNNAAESAAIGNSGGALGFGGLGSSAFAIEFDTYQNGGDPSANHISVLLAGDVSNPVATAAAPFDLNGGSVGYAWVEYDGASNQLSVYASSSSNQPATALITTSVNLASLGSRAFFGFTAGTGGLSNVHQVLSWSFESSTDLAPEPVSFTGETIVSGLNQPTSIDWSPDGQNMYISEKGGRVRVARNGVLQTAAFIDISAQVNGVRDRGLLDLAVHPDFVNNPYVYLLFTYDPPEVFGNTGLAGPDGRGNRAGRLIRVTANAATNYTTAVAGSEVVLLGTNSTWNNFNGFANSTNDFNEPPAGILPNGTNIQDFLAADSESHTVGGVEFGPDGALYVTNGDGTSYNQVDPRTVRVQDIDNLSGKVLRIDPISGQGLSSNPFYDGNPNANRSKVYQYGLRNPFRLTVNQATGGVYVGDVGWTRWEEVNSAAAGANFGWPYYEGASGVNARTNQYENLPEAQAFYASGQVATPSIFALSHSADGINAIVLGDFYTGSAYPSQYQGDLLVNDLGQGIVRNLNFDSSGNVVSVETFATGAQVVVAMKDGPDGHMYYVDLDSNLVGRWVVSQTANATAGSNHGSTGSDGATAATGPDWLQFSRIRARIDATLADGPVIINLADGIISSDTHRIDIPDDVRRFVATGERNGESALHVVAGAAGASARLRPGRLSLTNDHYRITANRFSSIAVNAMGNNSVAEVRGARGDDVLISRETHVEMTGVGYAVQLVGFDSVNGTAAGNGDDRAVFHDTAGRDVVSVAGRRVTLSSPTATVNAFNFDRSLTTSTRGDDRAVLTAGAGRDQVSISGEGTTIQNGRFRHEVMGFPEVQLLSDGRGRDTLTIVGSTLDENLQAHEHLGMLWLDDRRFVHFEGFDLVQMTGFNVHRDILQVGELEYELVVLE